jgi:F-type H+-transporting ATPase subunit delta
MITDARPYANAVFAIAKERGMMHEWSDALHDLAIISSNHDFHAFISNPKVDNQRSAALVQEILAKLAPKWLSALQNEINNLVAMLLAAHRFNLFPGIAAVFHEIMLALEDKNEAIVTSAVELSAKQKEKLRNNLSVKYGAGMDLIYKIDPAVLGGLRINIGNLCIDNTVVGRMSCLKETLEDAR